MLETAFMRWDVGKQGIMSDNSALDGIDGLTYEEIELAVMETSRGRWFLTEFARRHKATDTATLLNAIRRLEDQILSISLDAPDSTQASQVPAIDQPAGCDSQQAGSSGASSDHHDISDKIDRTTQLVRRLRNSHKLIGEAANKPSHPARPVVVKSTRDSAAADLPGFVRSDDDIFTDDRPAPSRSPQPVANAPEASARVPDQPAAKETSVAKHEADAADNAKKRIVVIRRPADQPGDIPLVDNAPEPPDDRPSAA
jgi:hypothetical protein